MARIGLACEAAAREHVLDARRGEQVRQFLAKLVRLVASDTGVGDAQFDNAAVRRGADRPNSLCVEVVGHSALRYRVSGRDASNASTACRNTLLVATVVVL